MLSAVILLKTHTFKGNVVRYTSMSRFMADFISILVYYFVRNIDPFYRFFYEALYSRLDISCTQAIFFSLKSFHDCFRICLILYRAPISLFLPLHHYMSFSRTHIRPLHHRCSITIEAKRRILKVSDCASSLSILSLN